MIVLEAHRALELLEDYHNKLTEPQDKQLRVAIERVIRIFKSRLFQALLGKHVILKIIVVNLSAVLKMCDPSNKFGPPDMKGLSRPLGARGRGI